MWSLTFVVVALQLGSLSGRVISHRTDSTFAREDGQQRDTVDQLELQFYETQLELYDTKFEVLKNEEQLLVAQIDTVRRQIKGRLHMMGSTAVYSRFMEWGEVLNIPPFAKLSRC